MWDMSVLCQGGHYTKNPTFPGVIFLWRKPTRMAVLSAEEFLRGT